MIAGLEFRSDAISRIHQRQPWNLDHVCVCSLHCIFNRNGSAMSFEKSDPGETDWYKN